MKKLMRYTFALVCVFSALTAVSITQNAYACTHCSCVYAEHSTTRSANNTNHNSRTHPHMYEEFADFEPWIVLTVYGDYLLPSFMGLTEQLTAVSMQNALAIGSFFDAENQLETQRLHQRLTAEAHKDYHPSVQMCTFGTNIRSLSSSQRRSEITSYVMSQRSIDRQMGQLGSMAAIGEFGDRNSRLSSFVRYYCSGSHNNTDLDPVCNADTNNDGIGDQLFYTEFVNKDLDFSRTVGQKPTLNIDFTNNSLTNDERDVFALANNLYSNEIMLRLPEMIFTENPGTRKVLLDVREVVAKRSVAENSFNTIVGLKSQGSASSTNTVTPYMWNILASLSINNPDDLIHALGDRPSYDAQMEVLTKRLYQSPEFFTNLYDKPVNVDRMTVAMQAIGLMQDFDTWDSYLRTEAMLSVLLEMELMRMQDSIQDQINLL